MTDFSVFNSFVKQLYNVDWYITEFFRIVVRTPDRSIRGAESFFRGWGGGGVNILNVNYTVTITENICLEVLRT